MRPKGPWDTEPDLLKPKDRRAPPAGLTTDQLETSNYYRDATPREFIFFWFLAILGSLGFWALVLWAIFKG